MGSVASSSVLSISLLGERLLHFQLNRNIRTSHGPSSILRGGELLRPGGWDDSPNSRFGLLSVVRLRDRGIKRGSSGLFEPQAHGLSPAPNCSACWRGYCCGYEVAKAVFRLRQLTLWLNVEQAQRPSLFGISARYNNQLKCFLYDDLQQSVPFTGVLLLGAEFIGKLYVHMGFHPAWKYRRVYELIVESGRVVEEADRSNQMTHVRERMVHEPLKPMSSKREDIMKWVDRCFSLDY